VIFDEHDEVQREIRKELGTELECPELLGVLENRFELDGTPGARSAVRVFRNAFRRFVVREERDSNP